MKKKLLALMMLFACGATAQAQSSVTVYGLLDMAYIGGNQSLTSTAGSAPTKTQTNAFASSAGETPSRLGFKGNEDLGGGTSAIFTTEWQLYPQDQNLSGSSNSGLLNRQTFVGLKQNGIGSVAFGRQYTPIDNYVSLSDPGGKNQLVGDVIYAAGTGGGAGTSLATTIDGAETNFGYVVRANNALSFFTDRYNGLAAQGIWSLNNSNTTQTAASTGGANNNSGYAFGLDYKYNKLNLYAALQSFKQLTTGTAFSVSSISNATITSGIDNNQYVAATYDFGILTAYAQYINRSITSTLNSSIFLKRSAEQIGVRSFITPKIEAWVSAGTGKYQQVSTTDQVKFNAYNLGANYWLSKRTNLYAIFGSTESSGNQAVLAGPGSSKNQYALGMKHTF
jgi:predicted porin